VIVRCRKRGRIIDFEKDAAAFAGRIGDPRQAALDQAAAYTAAGEFGSELDE
jgi:hypothetical protein